MSEVIRKALVLWGISLVAVSSVSLAQEGPKAQVKTTVERVLDILKDPGLKGPEKEEFRRKQIRDVIFARFNFNEMAKRSLGLHWRKRTPQEREEFVGLFADLLEQSYRSKIERYTDEEILFTKEEVEDSFAVVATKIISQKENLEIPIDYKVILRDGQWMIYDVVIDGISLVSNYRSQFNRIIQTSSYADLVRKMRVKQEAEVLSTVPTPQR